MSWIPVWRDTLLRWPSGQSAKRGFMVFMVGWAQALAYAPPALAQACVTDGGCGTSTERIETGLGCNTVRNCQDPEILGGPTFEVDPLPVTLTGPPRFVVRMAFEVQSPWNFWARQNNPNGQLQGRWIDSVGKVSACHSNLADRSKIWVQKTMTYAEM